MLERTSIEHLDEDADPKETLTHGALRRINQAEVSERARREARRREVHLPPVGIYRWWARRTDAVCGAVLDAVAEEDGTTDPMAVADAFAGGGVISLSARRRGHRIYAQNLNPWASFGLATMLGLPDPEALEGAAREILRNVSRTATVAYATAFTDGEPCHVAHGLRVARSTCSRCGTNHRMFPHALVSLNGRDGKPKGAFLACPSGHVHFAPEGAQGVPGPVTLASILKPPTCPGASSPA